MAVRLAAGAIPFQVLKRVGLRTSDDIVCSACRGNIPDFGEPTRRIGSSQTICKLRSNILTHQARPVRRPAGGSLALVRFSRQAPDSSVLRRIGCTSRLRPPVPTTPGSKSSPSLRSGSGPGQRKPTIFGACRRQVPMSARSPSSPRVRRKAGTPFRESKVRSRVRSCAPPPRRGAESTPGRHALADRFQGSRALRIAPLLRPRPLLTNHEWRTRLRTGRRRSRPPAQGVQGPSF